MPVHVLSAPVSGVVIGVEVTAGEVVAPEAVLVLLESMKMEVPAAAADALRVVAIDVAVGDMVEEGQPLLRWEAVRAEEVPPAPVADATPRIEPVRANLAALHARRALLADEARPKAVESRRRLGLRTARENVAALLDPGSFTEYGAHAVAAQRSRRSLDDLQRATPADGLITGTGTVDGRPVAVMVYDYMVLAGTQGVYNHRKSDRLLELCLRHRLPLVLYAEGGGGRPGDVDWPGVAGLDCTTFGRLAALSGQVPTIGVVAGRCFAGNAALLGCCDVIVAIEGASIGLGGPAMIEGGGLGRVEADDVGPLSVMGPNGVVDVRVPDDAAAPSVVRGLLGLLGGVERAAGEPGGDPDSLRTALPENRNALYDPRRIVSTVADAGTLIELRPEFGLGVVTSLARIGGRAVAIAASQPRHLGGALDRDACDKLARFMQLADAHGLPLVTFVDTPGFMVGPASEKTAMVRHAARLFVNAAALRVPVASVVLRRGYGLGAMALTAGHFHAPVATCAWPGAEFGPMGLEGAVRLGFRKELAAAPEAERDALFQRLLQASIERGQALNMASHLEIDDVIDPAETRDWIVRVLASACAAPLPPRRPFIDAW
ncbi:MAG: biotin carboxylase [Rubrivivax sp.]|nr:biotin carboxylase [Rubrivivax sp.]